MVLNLASLVIKAGLPAKFIRNYKGRHRKSKKEVEIVVVSFHWGIREQLLQMRCKTLAYYSIDNGADLIIGHHPHVIQGIEYYKVNTLITA